MSFAACPPLAPRNPLGHAEELTVTALGADVQKALVTRDYASGSFADRLSGAGVEAGLLAAADRTKAEVRDAWIPGVDQDRE